MASYQMDGFLKTIASKAKQFGRWTSTDLARETVVSLRPIAATAGLVPGVGTVISAALNTGISAYDANQARIAQADEIRAQDKAASAYIESLKTKAGLSSAGGLSFSKPSTSSKSSTSSNMLIVLVAGGLLLGTFFVISGRKS